MPKVDASAFARPATARFRRAVVDPANPGKEVVIEGRKLGKLEVSSATAYANDVYVDHMTGIGIPDKPGYVAPLFLTVGDEPVLFDLNSAQMACILFRCQTVPDEERYTPQEILRLMAVDALMDGLQEAAMLAMPSEEEKHAPLARRPFADPSSDTPCNEASGTTPPSSSEGTISSGASTTGLTAERA